MRKTHSAIRTLAAIASIALAWAQGTSTSVTNSSPRTARRLRVASSLDSSSALTLTLKRTAQTTAVTLDSTSTWVLTGNGASLSANSNLGFLVR